MGDKKRVLVIFNTKFQEYRQFDVSMIGITKDGKWLYYDGPIDKIPSGEWEEIALYCRQSEPVRQHNKLQK